MDFSSDANANFEGLLDVNREICMPQMAEKTSPDAPPNCAVVPYAFIVPHAFPFRKGETAKEQERLRLAKKQNISCKIP
ncbi:MAG TPA: hypothetical protein OGM06_02525 [Clostridiales bacterium]|nr:hypothetical protein [Clostridiales bacterium]